MEEENKKENNPENHSHSSNHNDENIEIKNSTEIERETDQFKENTEERAQEIKKDIEESLQKKKEEMKELEKEIKVEEKEEEELSKEVKELEEQKEQVEFIEKSTEVIKEQEEDEIAIDFSEIKNKAKNLFKGFKKKAKKEIKSFKEDEQEESKRNKEDEISFDFKKVTSFTKKNSRWLIPLMLIFIAIFVSSYFRMMPSDLPITEGWAENTVNNFYQNQIKDQINQQYPNLPEQNKAALVNKEFQNALKENKEQIKRDITQISQQYKANFQDENGETYLLAIDPYLWYSQARNVINHGHLGDKLIDGEQYFSLRDGRLDKKSSVQLHPYIAAYTYKFLHFFNRNMTLMRALFLLPAILIGLALIPTFFIGRKIAGNVGGFFAAIFLAINGPLLGRTPAGFADTDAYSILFPVIILWLFLEAYTCEKEKYSWLLTGLAGLFVGFYAATWSGWSYVFWFVIGSILLVLLIKMIYQMSINKISFELIKKINLKENLTQLVIFVVTSAIFVTLFNVWASFSGAFNRIIRFITLKEVGIKSIWPNVLTTVAEFNTISFTQIINQMGGKFLFFVASLGIILTLLKKNKEKKIEFVYFTLLLIWFAATAYSFTKGTRFAILMAPPFAIALGSAFGIAYEKFGGWLSKGINLDKIISKTLIFIILAIFLITPFGTAQSIAMNEAPNMNDAWYNALTKIKEDTADSVITSWWDFGHWFVAISERRVTFDGGDQGERIHWVGKTLLTDNEVEATGILRMLNCVQETAPIKLDEFTGDSLKSVQILYDVFQISNKNEAYREYLNLGLTEEQATTMLDYTHCQDLLPNYYITSEDMVGKAGVWGHFGSWNFEKATMYQTTKKMSRTEAVSYLIENFEMTEEQADQIHYEIQNTKGDQWIAPWPGYLSGLSGCETLSKNNLRCVGSIQGQNLGFLVDLNQKNVTIEGNQEVVPNTLVYATKQGIQEVELEGKHTGFSFVLVPNGENYNFILTDPLQANSLFTKMFFFEGHGLKCFSKFDDRKQVNNQRIITWKVDYDCQKENNVYFQPKEEVNAAHILISTQDKSEEEALKIIEEVKGKVNKNNFAELAKEYSNDPGSKENGGNLGWFGKGAMIPEFEETAYSLNVGDISEPIKTQFGYHLIMLIDKRMVES